MGSVQARSHNISTMPLYMTAGADVPFNQFNVLFNVGEVADRVPNWSIYPGVRDQKLREFWKKESIIAGAIYSIVAKMKSLPRMFEGPTRSVKFAEDLFASADFENGHMDLIGKTVQDLLTQDNGAMWELVGPGNPNGPLLGAPTEINYLDPARCYRTFDPTYPILYINPINNERHRIHKTRVISKAQMPQPDELARGVGVSALTRILDRVRLIKAITQHRIETATGTQRKAIIHGKGVSGRTLRRALRRADVEQAQEELIEYQGIPILTTAQGVELNVLSLAGIPDGYNMVDEHTIYVYIIALDLGVDAREIWPATVTGASKADASVQHMKARGKGFADLITTLEWMHEQVLKRISPHLKLIHDFVDDEQDKITTEIHKQRTEILEKYEKGGAITAKEFRGLAISGGILDAEVLDNIDSLPGMEGFEESEESEEESPGEGFSEEINEEAEEDEGTEFESELSGARFARSILSFKTERSFERSIRAAARGLWNGSFDTLQFIDAMDAALNRGLTDAAIIALGEIGFNLTDLEFEERLAITKEIADTLSFVSPLANWIIQNRKGLSTLKTVFDRIKLWVRTYNKMKNFVKSLVGGDTKLRWVWSPEKEHCLDCEKLNGRVYRASIWARYDIRPQSRRLKCKGFNCGCGFIPTTDSATPGFPPSIG